MRLCLGAEVHGEVPDFQVCLGFDDKIPDGHMGLGLGAEVHGEVPDGHNHPHMLDMSMALLVYLSPQ